MGLPGHDVEQPELTLEEVQLKMDQLQKTVHGLDLELNTVWEQIYEMRIAIAKLTPVPSDFTKPWSN